jgi:hypothetical protein
MAEAVARQQKTEVLARLYDGKLRLERRNGAAKIYACTYLQGKNIVKTTGEITLSAATKVATDWYLELRDRVRKGGHLHGRSFADMAEAFIAHANQLREVSDGQRPNYQEKWKLLKAYFEGVKVTDIDTKFLLGLRETRSRDKSKNGARVRPATLKKDMDFVRLVLRHARSIEQVIDDLPEFPSFRGEAWEVVPNPRPFLNHEQWVKLRKLGKARIAEEGLNPRT